MSVCVVITVSLAALPNFAVAGVFAASAAAAAAGMGLALEEGTAASLAGEQTVELCVGNADEVVAGTSAGQTMTFGGDGVRVVFYQDDEGRVAVRVSGKRSESELRELGETLAKRVVQQFAYHRVVTEMRQRNMNIVEEDVEEDGTVRMKVRVHYG